MCTYFNVCNPLVDIYVLVYMSWATIKDKFTLGTSSPQGKERADDTPRLMKSEG